MATVTMLPLRSIRTDLDTQAREAIDAETVEYYAYDLEQAGADLPPGVVFCDGRSYIMAAGFHTYWAHIKARRSHMPCIVRNGDVDDARLYSAGDNAKNSLRRTMADRNRAVLLVLTNPKASGWSDEQVSRHCAVGIAKVRALRAELSAGASPEEDTLFGPVVSGASEAARAATAAQASATGRTLRWCDPRTEENLRLSYSQVGRLLSKLWRHATWQGAEVPEGVRAYLERLAGRVAENGTVADA